MAKTDAELLRKDASGFRELYGRYAERVNGYHLRRCGSRDAAHDLTAETFAQAWFARRRVAWPCGTSPTTAERNGGSTMTTTELGRLGDALAHGIDRELSGLRRRRRGSSPLGPRSRSRCPRSRTERRG